MANLFDDFDLDIQRVVGNSGGIYTPDTITFDPDYTVASICICDTAECPLTYWCTYNCYTKDTCGERDCLYEI